MFLFPPIHFLKFLVKSQPQRSYKIGSYIKKSVQVVHVERHFASRNFLAVTRFS